LKTRADRLSEDFSGIGEVVHRLTVRPDEIDLREGHPSLAGDLPDGIREAMSDENVEFTDEIDASGTRNRVVQNLFPKFLCVRIGLKSKLSNPSGCSVARYANKRSIDAIS
jgi:hypothetical protein